jgi:hypothetical protein
MECSQYFVGKEYFYQIQSWLKELLISFELEEADGATKLRLQHEGISEEMHDDCVKGWNESFDKLERNIQ